MFWKKRLRKEVLGLFTSIVNTAQRFLQNWIVWQHVVQSQEKNSGKKYGYYLLILNIIIIVIMLLLLFYDWDVFSGSYLFSHRAWVQHHSSVVSWRCCYFCYLKVLSSISVDVEKYAVTWGLYQSLRLMIWSLFAISLLSMTPTYFNSPYIILHLYVSKYMLYILHIYIYTKYIYIYIHIYCDYIATYIALLYSTFRPNWQRRSARWPQRSSLAPSPSWLSAVAMA